MIIQEVEFNETDESKRAAILHNLGRRVILNDGHQKWCYGTLLEYL